MDTRTRQPGALPRAASEPSTAPGERHGAALSARAPLPVGSAPSTALGLSSPPLSPPLHDAWMEDATPQGARGPLSASFASARSAPAEPRPQHTREPARLRSWTDPPAPHLDAWLAEGGYGLTVGPSMDAAYADFAAALAAVVGRAESPMPWQRAVAESGEHAMDVELRPTDASMSVEGVRLGAAHVDRPRSPGALREPAVADEAVPAEAHVAEVAHVAQQYGKHPLLRLPAWFCAMGFVDAFLGAPQTYKYLSTPNQAWLMGRAAYSGSYGKVHLALASMYRGPEAVRVAIKVQRLEPKYFADGSSKTLAQTAQAIDGEIATFGRLRAAIEAQLTDWEGSWHGLGEDPFAKMRFGRAATQVFDAYTDTVKKKVYLAMTLELGSVDMLHPHVSEALATPGLGTPYVTALCTSLALQGFLELAALHQNTGTAHRDLKLQNMTFSRQGQLKLIDFGLCAPLDAGGYTAHFGLDAGSLLSPEMVLPGEAVDALDAPLPLDPVSSATDVHNLAADMLHLLSGGRGSTPFYKATRTVYVDGAGPVQRTATENDMEACQLRMLDVQALEYALLDGGFRAALVAAADATPLLREAMPAAQEAHVAFFAACFQHAPGLTLTLLDALRRFPTHRPSAFTLADSLVRSAYQLDEPNRAAVGAYFANHPNAVAQDAYFDRMEHYENLVAQGF